MQTEFRLYGGECARLTLTVYETAFCSRNNGAFWWIHVSLTACFSYLERHLPAFHLVQFRFLHLADSVKAQQTPPQFLLI